MCVKEVNPIKIISREISQRRSLVAQDGGIPCALTHSSS